ncbi:MAG: glycoside hydrolase family 15 protein [Anaerolineae bacterium]|nr:glycoside hydrolase family 15 protein [Anaerolineae bacterium]
MPDLHQRSIEIIHAGQFDGAYAACLSFSQYGYCWLRDGMWIAHGMDVVGQSTSARAFHQWAARTLLRYRDKAEGLLAKLTKGEGLTEADYLPTRFELDGRIGQEDWPDFQLDGYGAWLWGLVQFIQAHGDDDLWQEARPAVALLVRYLEALWRSPNYDCWEEHRHHIHPATLAALYGGLCAVQSLSPELVPGGLPETIRDFVLTNAVASDGHFMKYLGNDEVDASLLWLALPYKLVDIHDHRFLKTLAKIEQDIYRPGEGVYRYRADTYYGGGQWLLLTLWLAWAYLELDQPTKAQNLISWVEAQASVTGEMPEQVAGHLLAPAYYDQWVERWGTSASPLLWSHGMYLLLKSLLKDSLT